MDDPITMFVVACPFRKDGSPVVGNIGSSVRRVIIIDADNWTRLKDAIPALQTQTFRVGELG